MRNLLYAGALFVLIVCLGSTFLFPGSAFAKSLRCPTPYSNTTTVEYGFTSAHVSVTVWRGCDGGYYASAYSFQDSNGFAFHGTVKIINAGASDGLSTTCNRVGICNSPELYPGSGDSLYAQYCNNNGVFNGDNPCFYTSFITV